MTELIAIAAVAENGTIGKDGKLPWHHPSDLEHFRNVTIGHAVIMGRVTWDSLPTYLSDRVNIVLTRQVTVNPYDGFMPTVANSIDEAIKLADAVKGPAYVIGGASIYEQFLPHCSSVIITRIPNRYDGDVKFPEFDGEMVNHYTTRDGLVIEEYDMRSE